MNATAKCIPDSVKERAEDLWYRASLASTREEARRLRDAGDKVIQDHIRLEAELQASVDRDAAE